VFFADTNKKNKTSSMRAVLCIAILLAVAAWANAEADVKTQFLQFQKKFHKVYATAQEFEKRFEIFKHNLVSIAEKNARNTGTVHGVNQFTDMTKEEFKSKVLMRPPPLGQKVPVAPMNLTSGAPTSFDWRNQGNYVTPVYNQGQCGSCWAFSATENVESRWALAGNALTSLSMQQVVSCDTTDSGCNGGWPYNAYAYLIGAGGQESYSAYPYTAENSPCQFNAGYIVAKPTSWTYVTNSEDESQMYNYLYSNGPLSVCVDASEWSSYSGGVFMASSCTTSIDHCVDAIGYNVAANPPYWIIRNSWGTDWGISGYMMLQYGADACAVAQVVTSSII